MRKLASLFLLASLAATESAGAEGCIPTYLFSKGRQLSGESLADVKVIQKFNVQKKCDDGKGVEEIWLKKAAPNRTDAPSEKVLLCGSEKSFLVIRDDGKRATFALFSGHPCQDGR